MPQPTDSTNQLTLHPKLHNAVANVLSFGAVGDGTTDDSTAIAGAIAAASTVLFPTGYTFAHATTLVPANGTVWQFGGMRRYDSSTGGSALKYTGSGKAVDCTGVNNFELRDGKVEVTNTAAVAVYLNNCNYIDLTRVTLKGPGTSGTSYGIKAEGQGACQCHGTYKSVQVNSFATGIGLSGDTNANLFLNCIVSACTTGVTTAITGTDANGGDDNLFERFEFASGLTTGLVLTNSATRNVFVKCVFDGPTTAGTIASSVSSTVFVGCATGALPWTDSSTTTIYLGHYGTGFPEPGLFLADANLYRAGTNQLKTDDALTVAGALLNVTTGEVQVGGYSGGLHGSTGLGVFGNSEFQNALAIGGALDHNGTTVGFYGTTPAAKPTVTGSRSGNAALASLLTQLASLGLITDSSSA